MALLRGAWRETPDNPADKAIPALGGSGKCRARVPRLSRGGRHYRRIVQLPETIAAVAAAATKLIRAQGSIACAALVGSWATGRASQDSDVDLVLLLAQPERLLETDQWHTHFGQEATLVRRGDFGALQERRLQLRGDLIVEVNIGRLSWASIAPIDNGTRRVVLDGLVALHDPELRLSRLVQAVRGRV